MNIKKKKIIQQKRSWRIRKKVNGVAEQPRLNVRFSNKHIYAQCIDDTKGHTLCSMSTMSKDFKSEHSNPNAKKALELGKVFGEKAKAVGIDKVVFDRGTRRFHGAVKAFAKAARKSLSF